MTKVLGLKKIIKSMLRGELARGSLGSLAIKLVGMLLGLTIAVLLARSIGPEGYGVYAFVFAMTSLIAIPAQIGLPQLIMRETAMAHAHGEWGMMRGLWRWATQVVAVISILFTVSALLLGWFFFEDLDPAKIGAYAFGIALIPLVALANIRGAALRGLRKVLQGQLPEIVLRPGLFALLLLGTILFFPADTLSATAAMGLHVFAAAIAFIVGAFLLWRNKPKELQSRPAPVYEGRKWIGSAMPLAFISGMMLVTQHMDIVMLGLFRSTQEVGVYKVAGSLAAMVAFGLQAVTMAVSPHFARLYAGADMARLQHVVTQSARVILLLALPVVLALVFFGGAVLKFIFGNDFIGGQMPLAILAVGQLVNAAMGSVGALLNMTGHERETVRGVTLAAASNVIFNLILIPPLGMNGAALATALSMALWNFVLWRAVHRHLSLESMAFSLTSIGRL